MTGNGTLRVVCGPADRDGRRTIRLSLFGKTHRDKIDANSSFQRQKLRERFASILGMGDDAAAHAEMEDQILAAADSADSEATFLLDPKLFTLADVEHKEVSWHWEHYIPAGAITDLSGDPNEGKSTLAIDLAARFSRGDCSPPQTAPDETYARGSTLLLSAEDDLHRTIKPRLDAAGADMSRIHFLRDGHSFVAEEDRMVQLPTDLPTIENVIAELAIGMVIVDVFSAFIADGYNMNQDSDMRRCLSPIAALAERTQTVWLLLRHLNKREGTRSMYRGGGSIAIIGACRAGFAVAPHPEDADMKVFVPIKHNLGPRPPCLTYAIEQEGTSSRVIWGGPTELTAAEVMRAPTGRGGSKLEYAKEIIQDVLSGGPRGSNEVARACTDTGISDPTYWRARRSLGIVAEKTGFQGEWLLSLPSQNGQQHEEF